LRCSRPVEQPEQDEEPTERRNVPDDQPVPRRGDELQENAVARTQGPLSRLRTSLVISPYTVTTGGRASAPMRPLHLEDAPASLEDCPICMSTLSEMCVRTPCGHYFHQECLEQYFEVIRQEQARRVCAKCPICRASMHAPLPVEVSASSGLRIDVGAVPEPGSCCHFDRDYRFMSLGGFARPGLLYVTTSNEDRKTSASRVMWTIDASVPVTLYINFRGETHASSASSWLEQHKWESSDIASCITSGFPNGPYSGPVFSKKFEAGSIPLMGSNTWEGTYFVFVEVQQATNNAREEPVQSSSPDNVLSLTNGMA